MFNSPRDTNFNPNDDTPNKTYKWVQYFAWTVFGHPRAVVYMAVWLFLAPKLDVAALVIVAVLFLIPLADSWLLRRGVGPPRLVMWANVVRFRRNWFNVWTSTVKARDDHTTQALGLLPILSIIPRFKGSIGYFTVRPPAGQTLEFIQEIANPLAAQYGPVTQIEIIYQSPTDSKGTLQAVFGRTLQHSDPAPIPTPAAALTTPPTTPIDNPPVEDFTDLDWLNEKEPTQ